MFAEELHLIENDLKERHRPKEVLLVQLVSKRLDKSTKAHYHDVELAYKTLLEKDAMRVMRHMSKGV